MINIVTIVIIVDITISNTAIISATIGFCQAHLDVFHVVDFPMTLWSKF